jgi:DNA-binding response OmpR family regulator
MSPFEPNTRTLKMPGEVSGRDLFHWVLAHRPEASSSFVFVTGDTAGDQNGDFLERAGARFLWKPFSVDEYVQTVKEAYRATQRSTR